MRSDALRLRPGVFEPVLVIMVSLLGGIYCGLLLYQDLQRDLNESGSAIAQVLESQGMTERRSRISFLWSPIEPGKSLFYRDAVRVGPEGSAAIRMSDGSEIEMEPNSLIQFNDVRDFASGFIKGSFIVRTQNENKKIVVKRSGQRTTVILPKNEPRRQFIKVEQKPAIDPFPVRIALPKPAPPVVAVPVKPISVPKPPPRPVKKHLRAPSDVTVEVE